MKNTLFNSLLLTIMIQCDNGNNHARENNNMETLYNYEIAKAGEISPQGWIQKQLERDLTQGYIGQFDSVHNTVTHNVFINQNRRSHKQYRIIKEWWSGEHEGYWKDAVTRMAYLTNNEYYKRQAKIWMEAIVENTGKDGYIGLQNV